MGAQIMKPSNYQTFYRYWIRGFISRWNYLSPSELEVWSSNGGILWLDYFPLLFECHTCVVCISPLYFTWLWKDSCFRSFLRTGHGVLILVQSCNIRKFCLDCFKFCMEKWTNCFSKKWTHVKTSKSINFYLKKQLKLFK